MEDWKNDDDSGNTDGWKLIIMQSRHLRFTRRPGTRDR